MQTKTLHLALGALLCLAPLHHLRADPPAVSSATLIAWLDASDLNGNGSTPADGSNVSSWINKAPGGIGNFNLSSGGTVAPVWAANNPAFNGLPVVRFRASTGKWLTNTVNLGNNVTVIYAGRKRSSSVGRLVSARFNNWLLGYWGTNMGCSYWGSTGNFQGNAVADGLPHVWTGAANGSQFAAFRAERTGETQIDSGTLGAGPNGLSLGSYNNGSEIGGGDIAELLVYNAALSPTDRVAVQDYLASRWLPTGPVVEIPPQPVTAYEGEYAAALTVSAAGQPPLAYQWRRDGTNLPGATSTSLALPAPLSLAAAGEYTVVISNSFGSVTSTPAAVVVTPVNAVSAGLALYLPFDESSGLTAADATANGNNGALRSYAGDDSQWQPGRIGGSLRFGGAATSNHVYVGNYPKPATTLTIAAWVWADARPVWATIAKNWLTAPVSQFHFGLDNNTGDLSNYLITQGGTQIGPVREGAANPLPIGSWQHIALVCDGAAMRLYRNGVQVGTPLAYNGTIQNNPVNAFLGIGAKLQPNGTPATDTTVGYWNGRMDDLGLWTRGLTAGEILSIYRTGTNGQPLTAAATGIAPVVTAQSKDQLRYVGEFTAPLSVTIAGSTPLAYQWFKDEAPVPGAQSATLDLGRATEDLSGSYTAVVTNRYGGITSAPVVVTIMPVEAINEALAAYYNFDEGTGTLLVDNSGIGNDGTLVNYTDDSGWQPGRIGGALRFGGSTVRQYVTVPNYPKPSSTMTITAWVLAEARPVWASIVKNWQTVPTAQFHFGLDNNTGDLSNYLVPQPGAQIGPAREGAASPLPLNSWQHLAVVCDGRTMQIYRNGVAVGAPFPYDGTINTNCAAGLGIGVKLGPGGTPVAGVEAGYWQGRMDDMGIWRRGLLPDEIFSIYLSGLRGLPLTDAVSGPQPPIIALDPVGFTRYAGEIGPVLTASAAGTPPVLVQWQKDGIDVPDATTPTLNLGRLDASKAGAYTLVASGVGGSVTSAPAVVTIVDVNGVTDGLTGYWNFDEGTGTLLVDNSGNGNDGALNNYTDDSQWGAGQIGGALGFGGPTRSNYVFVPNHPASGGTLTISGWVYARSRPVWASILKNWPATGQEFHFGLTDSVGDLSNYLVTGDGAVVGPAREGTTRPLPTNSWQHVAVVCDGATMQVYRNGQPVGAPVPYNGTINTNRASPGMGIGAKLAANNLPSADVTAGFWDGSMDDLGLWNRGLTAAEIAAIYRAGCAGFALPEADPTAAPPVITQDAEPASGFVGGSASFTAAGEAAAGPVSYRWLFNGSPLPGESSSTLTLNNLQLNQAGGYQVVVGGIGGCVTGAVVQLTVSPNRPPVAPAAVVDLATPRDVPLSVLFTTLLQGWSDPDGHPLTVSAAGPLSTNGAPVTLDAASVLYSPLAGFIGVDRFEYTVSDGQGGLTTALAQIGVYDNGPGYNRVTPVFQGGQVQLSYLGVPGRTYAIQRSPTVAPEVWITLATVTADASGLVTYTDAAPPTGKAFYRTILP